MEAFERKPYVPNLKEYNQSRLLSVDILSGKEYRRKLRKEKRKKV